MIRCLLHNGYRTVSPIPDQSIRTHLDKILASSAFIRSARMARFLRYTVELALDGKGSDIKEYRIGLDVFDRRSDYDPRVDPIVRVEARRLRQKLAAYYAAEGVADEVVIDFEKGNYVPFFRPRTPATAPAPAAGPIRTIAALPFLNLGPDQGNDYFSDGLTEELIHALTRLPGLRVVAWNSAAQLRDQQPDVRAIGQSLQVAAVLTGSVRLAGARLRVSAQLVETATGYYLWSEAYDREVRDVFRIQEEIARAIVHTLRLRLSSRFEAAPIAPPRGNIEAYDLYLKGRYHWNMRRRDSLARAVDLFEQVIALDAGMALGYAGLADAYALQADFGFSPPAEAMPKARAAARHAIELDAELAEAWTSLAFIRSLHDWEWAEGETMYRRAIELNPGYATAHLWLGVDLLRVVGRVEEALASVEAASRLDPLSFTIHEAKAAVLLVGRQYEAAAAQYLWLSESAPQHYRGWAGLGRAHTQLGHYDEAIGHFERALTLGGEVPNVLSAMAQAQAAAGRPAEVSKLLDRLCRLTESRFVPSSCFALAHAAAGQTAEALGWLERGCEAREVSMAALKVHHAYDDLRGEPRFHNVLRRMNLEQ